MPLCLCACFFAFVTTGCTSRFDITVKSQGGSVLVHHQGDALLPANLFPTVPGFPIVEEKFSKKDYGILAYYRFQFGLSSALSEQREFKTDFPLMLSLTLPGKVLRTNAGRVEENVVVWDIKPGEKLEAYAETRHVRWLLVFILIVFSAYFVNVLRLRKR